MKFTLQNHLAVLVCSANWFDNLKSKNGVKPIYLLVEKLLKPKLLQRVIDCNYFIFSLIEAIAIRICKHQLRDFSSMEALVKFLAVVMQAAFVGSSVANGSSFEQLEEEL